MSDGSSGHSITEMDCDEEGRSAARTREEVHALKDVLHSADGKALLEALNAKEDAKDPVKWAVSHASTRVMKNAQGELFTEEVTHVFCGLVFSMKLEKVRSLFRRRKWVNTFTYCTAISRLRALRVGYICMQNVRYGDLKTISMSSYSNSDASANKLLYLFQEAELISSIESEENYPKQGAPGDTYAVTSKGWDVIERRCMELGVSSIEWKHTKRMYEVRLISRTRSDDRRISAAPVGDIFVDVDGMPGENPTGRQAVQLIGFDRSPDTDEIHISSKMLSVVADKIRQHLAETFTGYDLRKAVMRYCLVVKMKEVIELCDALHIHGMLKVVKRTTVVGLKVQKSTSFDPTRRTTYRFIRQNDNDADDGVSLSGTASITGSSSILSVDSNIGERQEAAALALQFNSIELATILRDPGLLLLFQEHTKEDFNKENVEFLLGYSGLVHELQRREKPLVELIIGAHNIYRRFICRGSPSELNLDGKMVEKIDEIVNRQPNDEKEWLKEIFRLYHEVSKHISRLLMMDSVPRFMSKQIR
ncbi:hypothetical protein CANCADRAFT_90949 [Tortispora caseinolytica NRRL Y-17796]|uniref:RGS domain-containing protein n=1 Tax=Tortispora caseinolytica NRRL Y-17796 TaxID=767744 RepID=A0A1E4TLQ5_9ASCO|nr:hypothetical protein CANCADRAFT_90949 [Tortispora caseinolytica NRRL Y-17796]